MSSAPARLESVTSTAVALMVNNVIVPLTDDRSLEMRESSLVSRDSPEGSRVYKRSIALLLAAAAQKNGLRVSIGESLGASFFFNVSDSKNAQSLPTESIVKSLRDTMLELIAEKSPISLCKLSRSELVGHLKEYPSPKTLELVESTPDTHFLCYTVNLGVNHGPFVCLAHGPIVPNASYIEPDHFAVEALTSPYPHYRLYHATRIQHATTPITSSFEIVRTEEPAMLSAYETRKAWGTKISADSVTSINKAISESNVKRIVQLSEALHDQQVVNIANKITGSGNADVGKSKLPRLVLIAGPSSSGKTTFAKRLCVALETQGAQPVVISVDSYYKAWQEIDERGMSYVDWESLKSLNVDLLNQHLSDLLEGKEVMVPEYDMKTSMPLPVEHWVPTKLPQGGLIIIEGIHGLNPSLTPRIPKEDKFHIMISPLSAIILDDLNMVSSSQVRQLRRMVRDYLTRGRSAVSTLKQWTAVALGERQNIYPHQNNADVVMNSGLSYEVNVLKVYAEPLLRSITPDLPEYGEARRLLAVLDRIVAMPAQIVPPQSLLREFVGGSWFYEYGGWYKSL